MNATTTGTGKRTAMNEAQNWIDLRHASDTCKTDSSSSIQYIVLQVAEHDKARDRSKCSLWSLHPTYAHTVRAYLSHRSSEKVCESCWVNALHPKADAHRPKTQQAVKARSLILNAIPSTIRSLC